MKNDEPGARVIRAEAAWLHKIRIIHLERPLIVDITLFNLMKNKSSYSYIHFSVTLSSLLTL